MEVEKFIEYLHSLDIRLWIDDDKLRVNAPGDALTLEIKAELKRRKPEILDFLGNTGISADNTKPVIKPVKRAGRLPLSFSQERLWSLAKLQPDSSVYNIPSAFRLRGSLNTKALEESLRAIQQRHEILRTSFPVENEKSHQLIALTANVELLIDVPQSATASVRAAEVDSRMKAELKTPLDTANGPLWRARLFRINDQDHILTFVMHHLVFDGWSKNLFMQELEEFYNAISSNNHPQLPKPTVQYADYAQWHGQWLASDQLKQQESYWKEQLSNEVEELKLPTDRCRLAGQDVRGANQSFQIPGELITGLHSLSREQGVSLFITLLTAFNILLNRYTGQEDLVLCLPVACRNRSELEKLIGFLNNIVVMRTDLSGDPSTREAIARVRPNALTAYENQDYPFQRVAEFENLVRVPLTRGMFSYRNTPDQGIKLASLDCQPIDIEEQSADFDLAMYIRQNENQFTGLVRYNVALFEAESIATLIQSYLQVLRCMVEQPDNRLSALAQPGLNISSVQQLLETHPQVDEVAVIKRKGQLVAYIVPNQLDVPNPVDLRSYLRQRVPDYLLPGGFVPLDAMPLTETGSVNVDVLPEPPETLLREVVAPRTDLESRLLEIWKKALWLDSDIGITDNFFDLGGHSLLAVQLVHETEKLLGRKLPAQALIRLSTVEDMAGHLEQPPGSGDEPDADYSSLPDLDQETSRRLEEAGLETDTYYSLMAHTAGWRGKRATERSLIIGLNTEGSKQALFWCFQGFNELTQMAKYLGTDQPVYGMRSGHLVMEKNRQSVLTLAAYYAREILTIQPKGPFLIGGNCQSAKIAFQMALLLKEWGHHITLLCLQEQFIPQPYHGPVAFFYGDHSVNNPHHYFDAPEERWKKFYTGRFSINTISGKHEEFFREPNIQSLAEKLRNAIEQAKSVDDPADEEKVGRTEENATGKRVADISATKFLWATPGETVTIRVKVRNCGDKPWKANEVVSLSLGSLCFTKKGQNVLLVDTGTPLGKELNPGESAHIKLPLLMPGKEGRFRFEIDMLDQNDTWFHYKGSQQAIIKVRVYRRFLPLKWLRSIKQLFTMPFSGSHQHR
jgi:thioesterase domain-containing protein/acyl carrier protein